MSKYGHIKKPKRQNRGLKPCFTDEFIEKTEREWRPMDVSYPKFPEPRLIKEEGFNPLSPIALYFIGLISGAAIGVVIMTFIYAHAYN